MFKAMLSKEFILILRDKHALAALFIMPAIFILVISLALKDSSNNERALLNYTVIDNDNTDLSKQIRTVLAQDNALNEHNLNIKDESDRRRALNEELQFIVTIPKGFGMRFYDLNAKPLLLHIEVASDIKQEMLSLFNAALAFAQVRLIMDSLKKELIGFSPEIAKRLDAVNLDPDSITTVRFNTAQSDKKPTSTQQSVPSWIVFGMFFVIIPMSTIFISESKQNTLIRMNTMNISIPLLFAGKIVPYMVINQIQVWLMIAVGIFIVPLFGAAALTLGHSLTGLVMVSVGLSIAAIGTSILIAVSVSSVEQATTIGGIINILMGIIGGVMVPKYVMPLSMQAFSHISPMSWGLEGFLDIFLRGLGAEAVAVEFMALAGFGIAMLLIAGIVFSYKMRRWM